MNIEDDLRQALRRKPAPPDLAARVMARLNEERAAAPTVTPFTARTGTTRSSQDRGLMWPMRWLAAAAAAAVVVTGAAQYYTYQQTVAEAERVHQDIRVALQITSEKLAVVQRRIDRSVQDSER
jgi:hypothetical protein